MRKRSRCCTSRLVGGRSSVLFCVLSHPGGHLSCLLPRRPDVGTIVPIGLVRVWGEEGTLASVSSTTYGTTETCKKKRVGRMSAPARRVPGSARHVGLSVCIVWLGHARIFPWAVRKRTTRNVSCFVLVYDGPSKLKVQRGKQVTWDSVHEIAIQSCLSGSAK